MQTLNPKDPLIQQNLPYVKKLLYEPRAKIYFVASPWLRQTLADGKHPMIQGIVPWIKDTLVSGKGLIIQKRIVWELINGTLDQKNTFVFSNGDIRITWTDINPGETDVGWEDKNLMVDILKVQEKEN